MAFILSISSFRMACFHARLNSWYSWQTITVKRQHGKQAVHILNARLAAMFVDPSVTSGCTPGVGRAWYAAVLPTLESISSSARCSRVFPSTYSLLRGQAEPGAGDYQHTTNPIGKRLKGATCQRTMAKCGEMKGRHWPLRKARVLCT